MLPFINLHMVIPITTSRKITAREIDTADVNPKESAKKTEEEKDKSYVTK